MGGLGTILEMSWDHCEGTDPLIWTKDVKLPHEKEDVEDTKTICSVSTSFATSPYKNIDTNNILKKSISTGKQL